MALPVGGGSPLTFGSETNHDDNYLALLKVNSNIDLFDVSARIIDFKELGFSPYLNVMGRTHHRSKNESNIMRRNAIIKSIVAVLLTAILTLGACFMIGPQIMIIVPVAIVGGIIFAFRRSFVSLVCFGYPFTFGLVSAYIGYVEIDGYTRTAAFAISVVIGLLGAGLIAAGLWKALPDRTIKKSNGAAEQGLGRKPDHVAI